MLEGINDEQTERLVTKYFTELPEVKNDPDAISVKFAESIAEFKRKYEIANLNNILSDPELARRDRAFWLSYRKTGMYDAADKLTPEEQRILRSDVMAVHYLLTSGRLNDLYDRLEKKPIEKDEEVKLKTAIVCEFVEHLRNRTSEKRLLGSGLDLATVGLELEYFTQRIYHQEIASKESTALAFQEDIPSMLARYGGGSIVPRPETAHSHASEYVSNPSISKNQLLQDIFRIIKAGGFKDGLNFHFTFGGVELSKNHTEIMDIRAIAVAAGLNGDESVDVFREEVPKNSKVVGEKIYFPFARVREKLSAYASKEIFGVEIRSFFSTKNFGEFCQLFDFLYCSAQAVKAYQKESGRTEIENKLANIWTDSISEWEDLLKTKNLKNPSDDERYILIDDPTEVDLGEDKTVYQTFLGTLTQQDMEFKRKSFEATIKLRQRVKVLLGY